MNYLRTDYSLDLDHSQILLQLSPNSQVFEVCQIIKKDFTLLMTFLVTIYHEQFCVLLKQVVNKEAGYGVSLSSQKMEQLQCFLLGRLSGN